jgi:chitinase
MFLSLGIGVAHASPQDKKIFVAYYESWYALGDGTLDSILTKLPPEISILNLAFAKPDAVYQGSLDLSGSGLEFPYTGTVLKSSIEEVKKKNPQTKVLISVGGESFQQWNKLNPSGIRDLVLAFGLDGIDIDFEPLDPGCHRDKKKGMVCQSDPLLQQAIDSLRAVLPRPMILSLTLPSDAAFGAGRWATTGPEGSPSYGLGLALFRDKSRSADVDLVNIMMYDAGPELNAMAAYESFRDYYRGALTIGFTPPPEEWGTHAYDKNEVRSVLAEGLKKGANGAMLFGLRKKAPRSWITPFVNTIAVTLSNGEKE